MRKREERQGKRMCSLQSHCSYSLWSVHFAICMLNCNENFKVRPHDIGFTEKQRQENGEFQVYLELQSKYKTNLIYLDAHYSKIRTRVMSVGVGSEVLDLLARGFEFECPAPMQMLCLLSCDYNPSAGELILITSQSSYFSSFRFNDGPCLKK